MERKDRCAVRRYLAVFLAVLVLLGALVSCGEQRENPAVSSDTPESGPAEPATGTEPASEPGTEAPQTEEPAAGKYETEYVAPADGSFTVCGVPLSEYTLLVYFPGTADYQKMDRHMLTSTVEDTLGAATGTEWKCSVTKNEKYFQTPKAEHEILFGNVFEREGMPELEPDKNCYGVTADGTVYFSSPSPVLYRYLWQLFLEEFFGVPYGSGAESAGCAIPECYRELPLFTAEDAEALGYLQVFSDEFDGEELDLSVWSLKHEGDMGGYFETASQEFLRDGNLILRGEWLEDGPYGEGWYTGDIGLIQRYGRGYFESRIQCSECLGRGVDFWSAFWIQGPAPYTPDQSQGGAGPGGAELDVMENFGPDYHTSCLWVSGVEGEEGLSNDLYEVRWLQMDFSKEYHTYALLWDEEAYRIYVDGILICFSDFAYGTSPVEEEVRLSLCCRPGVAEQVKDNPREMKVDYLRIWQKPAGE